MSSVRIRQLAALPAPLYRALRWQPLFSTGAAGVVLGVVLPASDEASGVLRARFVAGALGAAAAYLAEDDAANVLASSPSPRRFRGGLRVVVSLVAGYAWWAAVAAVGARRAGGWSLVSSMWLDAVTLLVLGLAAAALASRRLGERGCGVAAAPLLLGLLLVSAQLPEAWSLMGDPADSRVRARWVALLVAALLTVLRWLGDPARRVRRLSGRIHVAAAR